MNGGVDTVFVGPVWLPGRPPQRGAVAVDAGRIVAVGGDEVRALAGPRTDEVDLGGGLLVPGFTRRARAPGAGWSGADAV